MTEKTTYTFEPMVAAASQDIAAMTTQMIKMLAEGIPKHMVAREHLSNAMESCMKKWNSLTPKEREVYIAKIYLQEVDGCLQFVDNGLGCDQETYIEHYKAMINSSNNSDGVYFDENKGIGAKICTLPWSDMEHYSKTIDSKWWGKMYEDPTTGLYGNQAQDFCDIEGDEIRSAQIDMSPEKCEKIFGKNESGFCVRLLGRGSTLNQTFKAVEDELTQNHSSRKSKRVTGYPLIKYLNQRYYEFPSYLNIYAPYVNKEGRKHQLKIRGTKYFMDMLSVKSCSCSISYKDMILPVEFSILDSKKTKDTGHFLRSSFISILYKNELYGNYQNSPSSRYADMRRAGISAGFERLQLKIEIPNEVKVKPNAGRTGLLYMNEDGSSEEIVLDDILEIIKRKLPQEIQDYVAESLDQSIRVEDIQKDLQKYLKYLKHILIPPNDTKPDPLGEVSATEDGCGEEDGAGRCPGQRGGGNGNGGSGGNGGGGGGGNAKPKPKSRFNNGQVPEVIWTDLYDPDLCIEWNEKDYKLFINSNTGYNDFVKKKFFPQFKNYGKTLDEQLFGYYAKNCIKFLYESYAIPTKQTRDQVSKKIQTGIGFAHRLSDDNAKTITKRLAQGRYESDLGKTQIEEEVI